MGARRRHAGHCPDPRLGIVVLLASAAGPAYPSGAESLRAVELCRTEGLRQRVQPTYRVLKPMVLQRQYICVTCKPEATHATAER